jgi:hypothetical protein
MPGARLRCFADRRPIGRINMEGVAAAHFIVNMGAGNGIFIVGM